MTTRSKSSKRDFESFEYVLNDFLELEAGVDPRRAEPLRSYLFSEGEGNFTLSPIEGFRLNGYLILIDKDSPGDPRRLIFFNPDKGSFRVKEI